MLGGARYEAMFRRRYAISIALMSPTVALAFQNLVLAVLSGLGVRFPIHRPTRFQSCCRIGFSVRGSLCMGGGVGVRF